MLQIRDGLYYNPYFPGGAIAMPQMLIDGAVEYEDGTPATESQVILLTSPLCFVLQFSLTRHLLSYNSLLNVCADGERCCFFSVMGR